MAISAEPMVTNATGSAVAINSRRTTRRWGTPLRSNGSTTSLNTSGGASSMARRIAARTTTCSDNAAAATNTLPTKATLIPVVRSSRPGRAIVASPKSATMGGMTQPAVTRPVSSLRPCISYPSTAREPRASARSTKRWRRSTSALRMTATVPPNAMLTRSPRVASLATSPFSNKNRGTRLTTAAVPMVNSTCQPRTRDESLAAVALMPMLQDPQDRLADRRAAKW